MGVSGPRREKEGAKGGGNEMGRGRREEKRKQCGLALLPGQTCNKVAILFPLRLTNVTHRPPSIYNEPAYFSSFPPDLNRHLAHPSTHMSVM